MPIHLEDLTDLAQLVAVLDLQKLSKLTSVPLQYMPTDRLGGPDASELALREAFPSAYAQIDAENAHVRPGAALPDRPLKGGTPASPAAAPEPSAPEPTGALPDRDVNGLLWDDRIHSTPAKLKADGAWRARRGVSDELVAEVTAELLARPVADTAPVDPNAGEPVATETHALPQSAPADGGSGVDPIDPNTATALDLSGLLELAKEQAGDASDSLQDLLGCARDFNREHGVPVFQQIKAMAAPAEDGRAGGKGLQLCTPGERRLLRACLDNYHLFA